MRISRKKTSFKSQANAGFLKKKIFYMYLEEFSKLLGAILLIGSKKYRPENFALHRVFQYMNKKPHIFQKSISEYS